MESLFMQRSDYVYIYVHFEKLTLMTGFVVTYMHYIKFKSLLKLCSKILYAT